MTDDLHRRFGFETIEAGERRAGIRRRVAAVARRYDLMNDVMARAWRRRWKRRLVKAVAVRPGETMLDLASGGGDVAIALAGPGRQVIMCDPSVAMMAVRRRRGAEHIVWVAGEAEALPFATDSLDGVTIAFGIRNVARLDRALAEILRALKPGGRLLCLEFSRPRPWFRPFSGLVCFAVVARLGAWIARTPEAYVSLVESFRRFPDQAGLKRAMEAAGFEGVAYRDLTFGVVTLHVGLKPLAVRSAAPGAVTP